MKEKFGLMFRLSSEGTANYQQEIILKCAEDSLDQVMIDCNECVLLGDPAVYIDYNSVWPIINKLQDAYQFETIMPICEMIPENPSDEAELDAELIEKGKELEVTLDN
jgi:hypothetical protein